MKHLTRTLLIGLLLIIISCDKVDDLLTFSINHSANISIESNLPINLGVDILTPDIQTNSSQEFKNNKTRAELVKDVKLESLNLTITSPSGKTFSFLKSIHIYISAEGQQEIELAYLDDISSSATTLALTTTSEKLDPYVKAAKYNLRTTVVTRETLTQDVMVKTDLKFKVTAEPL